MTTAVQAENGGPLTQGQQAALVRLLEDDDPAVREPVRNKILGCGPSAVSWLHPHLQDPDPVVRRRVQELLEYFSRQEADNAFLTFCLTQGEDLDLEAAVWLLARTRYPDINVAAYTALLDSYGASLKATLAADSSPATLLAGVNQELFVEQGYTGNATEYYDPENSYFNRVMDRRTGNPISLCALYLFVARRLQLPVAGVGMPGHFLCRYQSSTEEIYVDPFHGGKLLTKADCARYLAQSSFGFQEGLLSPVTPRRMLLRMCANLHQIQLHLRDKEETSRFQRYVVALAK